ncbi:MAG: hypothetical protein AB1757_03825 [Acidobacteriota bacterium]
MVKNLISIMLVMIALGVFTVVCWQLAIPAKPDEDLLIPNEIANDFTPAVNQNRQPARILLDKAQLIASAKAGGDYLVRLQKADGSFHYYYDAARDKFETRTYNIVRHAGTAYSLFELYAATKEARYLEAANRACRFLKTRFRPAQKKNAIYVLDFDNKAKLGANALALLALAEQMEVDAKSANREDARKLANMILTLQNPDGSFESYHSIKGDEPDGNVSLYYPGEALLALIRFYKFDDDKKWLEAARRGADYLQQAQSKTKPLPPDAWFIQALEALNKLLFNQKYFDHALAIADSLIATQYSEEDSVYYAGAFSPGIPRVTPTASRAEGLLAAYRMAELVKDWRTTTIALSLRACARFQISQQFTADTDAHLPNPQRALGGFRESIDDFHVRIDYVQHNISALLGIAETLY